MNKPFFFLLTILFNHQAEAAFWTHYNITIFNEVNNTDLTIHCSSKDNDLGVHVVKYNKSFSWTFKPNVIGTTLFHCNFRTQEGVIGDYAVFDYRIGSSVIKANGRLGTLVWSVRPANEICLLDGKLKLHNCFKYGRFLGDSF